MQLLSGGGQTVVYVSRINLAKYLVKSSAKTLPKLCFTFLRHFLIVEFTSFLSPKTESLMKLSNHTLRRVIYLFLPIVLCQGNAAAQFYGTEVQEDQTRQAVAFQIKTPTVALSSVVFAIGFEAVDADGQIIKAFAESVNVAGIQIRDDGGETRAITRVSFEAGEASIPNAVFAESGTFIVKIQRGSLKKTADVRVLPGILSLLPPLLAIALAFTARQVLISLFCGIWLGAFFIFQYNPITGFLRTADTYLLNSLANNNHAAILIFSLTLGGMVGVISKAGGTQGIVERLAKFANHARGGQLATWAMGLLIFFDDYANTLIVGNTMRPFTDRLKISREKLSYIVDSTAAPVASIAPISTWVGFQVGLIAQAFAVLGINQDGYSVFLESIPFASYSILALVFVFLIGVTLRDYGPMYAAETRSMRTGQVLRPGAQPLADSASLDMVAGEGTPLRWYNAIVPILVVILVTLAGLYLTGKESLGVEAQTANLGKIIGAANSFSVLLWASFTGLFVAAVLAVSQKILDVRNVVEAAVNGYKSMMMAAMILILAWGMGEICKDLHTADYVIAASKGILSPHLIPFVTFVIAAFISFSTGSSWATMAILTPIVIPIAYKLPVEAGLAAGLSHEILIGTIGAILSGSVLGDHCSPISDTTILSSMACAADHVDHVRTQTPYAIIVGIVAIVTGYIPNGWGVNNVVSLAAGTLVLAGIVFLFGKKLRSDSP